MSHRTSVVRRSSLPQLPASKALEVEVSRIGGSDDEALKRRVALDRLSLDVADHVETEEPGPDHAAREDEEEAEKGAGRRKRCGLHKSLQCGEGISTGMSRGASAMGSADLGQHQEASCSAL